MPRKFTVSALTIRVRERAGLEGTENPTDAEIYRWLSSAYTRLYDRLVASGEHYYESTETITTAAGTASYAVPATHYATLAVDLLEGQDYEELEEIGFAERNDYGGDRGTPQAFRLVGGYVVLYPTPDAVYTLRHYYVPAPSDLTSGATEIDGVSGWEEYMVILAAISARQKEESDTTDLERELARMDAELERNKTNRSLARASRVRDTATRSRSWDPADDWRP